MVVRKAREEWKIHANVFDSFTKTILFSLSSQGLFDELERPLAIGKEANVFIATPGRRAERRERVVVKIYRVENCNFKRMHEYLRADPRYPNPKRKKRETVFAWCQREYKNLLLASTVIRAPKPLGFKKNVLVMTLVGDAKKGAPAEQLQQQPPRDPEAFEAETLRQVRALWQAGLVHGDLSPFNILNEKEKPVFIDFSQATLASAPNAQELLERDERNVTTYFRKLREEGAREGAER